MPRVERSQKGIWRCRLRKRYFVLLAGIAIFVHLASREGALSAAKEIATSQQKQVLAGPGVIISPIEFQATAYSGSGITKSGAPTSAGLVAADPKVLPLGSVIHVETPAYRGVYQVMDTGRLVKGKIIDIFLPSLESAVEFGRQKVKVTVLRYGFSAQSKGSKAPASSPE